MKGFAPKQVTAIGANATDANKNKAALRVDMSPLKYSNMCCL